jgi:hypothetical protein
VALSKSLSRSARGASGPNLVHFLNEFSLHATLGARVPVTVFAQDLLGKFNDTPAMHSGGA